MEPELTPRWQNWDFVSSQLAIWWQQGGWTQALMVLIVGWIAALIFRTVFSRVIISLSRRTKTDLDDKIVDILYRPIGWSAELVAVWYAFVALAPADAVLFGVRGVLGTIAVVLWTRTLSQISHVLLEWLSEHSHEYAMINQRTLPVFDFAATAIIYGGAAFFLFIAWNVNPTAWLASAGVVGIAVGFASQETVSNLIAGVFILADAPYKLGDFLELEGGTRGRVVEIGIRTTRIITADDVEIIVPNALIANGTITNQSGGPHEKFRIRVEAGVAYGSDIDRVRALLMEIAEASPFIIDRPKAQVRFTTMGDSALIFALNAWVEEPGKKETAIDDLNTRIYKALIAEGFEIPYPKTDVYLYPQSEG